MAANAVYRTVEMHTGGDPVRIITSGFPPIVGKTILEKLKYVEEHLDHVRKRLMLEPRGHRSMYGAVFVEKDAPDADLAALLLHYGGYAHMCGHVAISLGRYAVDRKLVKPVCPATLLQLQLPCGVVSLRVEYDGKKSGSVWFKSVPSFVLAANQVVTTEKFGKVLYDVVYSGSVFAIVDAKQVGLDVAGGCVSELEHAAIHVFAAIKSGSKLELTHPQHGLQPWLGLIFIEDSSSYNFCLYGQDQICRAPCGSGVVAQVALQHQKNRMTIGQLNKFFSAATGSMFTASLLEEVQLGSHSAVVVEVGGKGHYCGESAFWVESDDSLVNGFVVQ